MHKMIHMHIAPTHDAGVCKYRGSSMNKDTYKHTLDIMKRLGKDPATTEDREYNYVHLLPSIMVSVRTVL